MFAKLRQRRAATRGVEFCDSCGRVCTSECRAQARLHQLRGEAAHAAGSLR